MYIYLYLYMYIYIFAYVRDENEFKKKEEFLRWKDKKDAEIKDRERMEVFICVYVCCIHT
jgi:hypothetical protein